MEALPASEAVRSHGLDWIEAESLSHFAAAEAVAQAGAGGLLLSVGVAEFFLGVWSAGWWQRSGVVLLAAIGLAIVARAIAPVFARVRDSSGRQTERADEPLVAPMATRDGACAY